MARCVAQPPAIRVGGRSEARALSQGRPPADLAAAGLSRPDGRGWRESRHADRRRDLEGCRSEEHTSELQSLMRISYAVFCLKKTKTTKQHSHPPNSTSTPK